jgi:hypothetical protein
MNKNEQKSEKIKAGGIYGKYAQRFHPARLNW